MKKVLAIVLSVAMLACFAIPAFAADEPVFTIESMKAEAGSTVTVNVKLDSGLFDAANLIIEYDNAKAEVILSEDEEYTTAVTNSLSMQAGNVVADKDTGVKHIEWGASTTKKVKSEVLFSFIVKVAEGLAEGDTIEFTAKADSIKYENNDVTPTFNTGVITIGKDEPVPSDPSKTEDPSTAATSSQAASVTSTASTTTSNPKTGDAGVAVFAAIVAAAAAAAFVAGKKNA